MPNLIHDNEKTYFTLCVVISALIYLMLVISIVGIIYILLGFVLSLFVHGLMIGHIRLNGVKLTRQQFPDVLQRIEQLCIKMNVREVPDVFVIQSGSLLNAFATRFFGRNFIILYSDIFELVESGNNEELDFVITHELVHIQRNHVTRHLLILPSMWVPFLGNAYSRACEYTCDRSAAFYTGNSEAAINALTLLAIGKILYKRVNQADYLYESSRETGFFTWLSEILSSHPPLPKRILEIERLNKFIGLVDNKNYGNSLTSSF